MSMNLCINMNIFERNNFLIGYLTAPILGWSVIGIDLNTYLYCVPRSDMSFADIGLKLLLSYSMLNIAVVI
jgi:hypothetical protein